MFIECFDGCDRDQELQFHHICYGALDVVEERVQAAATSSSGSSSSMESYLGVLFPTEEHIVYGYMTATWIKFLLVVDDRCPLDDNEAMQRFKALHLAYMAAACNPFRERGDAPLISKAFKEQARRAAGLV